MSSWNTLHARGSAGRVVWIGLRPARLAAMHICETADLDPVSGISGDHYAGRSQRKRQVTLIQFEHLAVIAAFTGRAVTLEQLRRNVAIADTNLLALKGAIFTIGSAVLRGTGLCHPCSRMESALGPGGYAAMLGHGGITAEIVHGGRIRVGDAVSLAQGDLFDEIDPERPPGS